MGRKSLFEGSYFDAIDQVAIATVMASSWAKAGNF
jgi:hypothetical protein